MSNLKHWISAARLRTLPLSVSGIVLAGCFAEYNGFFKWIVFLLAILTTLSLQILSNFANDYGDGIKGTDNNERVGPMRTIQSGLISPEDMYKAIKVNILVTIALAFFLILAAFGVNHFWYALTFFVLGGLSIYASIKYTIGDNAYGYKGLGDIYVFVFFGLVSTIGGYFLFSKQIDNVIILPACIVGVLSAAVLNLNNLRDIKSDSNSNKITLAVRLGFDKAKSYHSILIISAVIMSIIFAILFYTNPLNFIFLVVIVPLLNHLKRVKKTENPSTLDPELKKVALSTFALAVLLGTGYLL